MGESESAGTPMDAGFAAKAHCFARTVRLPQRGEIGRGFSRQNLWQMRLFYTAWPGASSRPPLSGQFRHRRIPQTPSGESGVPEKLQTLSGEFPDLPAIEQAFALP